MPFVSLTVTTQHSMEGASIHQRYCTSVPLKRRIITDIAVFALSVVVAGMNSSIHDSRKWSLPAAIPFRRPTPVFLRPTQGFKLATGHHRVGILSLNHLLKHNVSELKNFRDCLKIKVFYPCNYGLMLGLQWRSTIKVRDKIIFGLMDESYWFFFDGCYHTPWIALTRKFLIDRHGL